MVSPNEAGFNLRETFPLSRNNLHTPEVTARVGRDSERVRGQVTILMTTAAWPLVGQVTRFQPLTCCMRLTFGIPQRAAWVREETATYSPS